MTEAPDDDADPFRHVPALRGLIADPAASRFRDLDYADFDRRMREAGRPPTWRRTHEEREATREAALAGRFDDDLWVFAYGSLMWDPAIVFNEVREAHLVGYRRSFCLKTTLGRGSDDFPGLMAALDTGGSCHGLAFRIARDHVDDETERLWRREMIFPGYLPVFVPAATPQGAVEALAFAVMHAADSYVGDLPPRETARMVATAAGVLGTNLEYIDSLARHFRAMGIVDDELFALHERASGLAEESSAAG